MQKAPYNKGGTSVRNRKQLFSGKIQLGIPYFEVPELLHLFKRKLIFCTLRDEGSASYESQLVEPSSSESLLIKSSHSLDGLMKIA